VQTHDGVVAALVVVDHRVLVDADDQVVAEARRLGQEGQVAHVEQVERAGHVDDAVAGRRLAPLRELRDRVGGGQELADARPRAGAQAPLRSGARWQTRREPRSEAIPAPAAASSPRARRPGCSSASGAAWSAGASWQARPCYAFTAPPSSGLPAHQVRGGHAGRALALAVAAGLLHLGVGVLAVDRQRYVIWRTVSERASQPVRHQHHSRTSVYAEGAVVLVQRLHRRHIRRPFHNLKQTVLGPLKG